MRWPEEGDEQDIPSPFPSPHLQLVMADGPPPWDCNCVFPSHCHQVFAHEAYDTPIGHYCCDVALYIKKEYNLTELYSGPYLQI